MRTSWRMRPAQGHVRSWLRRTRTPWGFRPCNRRSGATSARSLIYSATVDVGRTRWSSTTDRVSAPGENERQQHEPPTSIDRQHLVEVRAGEHQGLARGRTVAGRSVLGEPQLPTGVVLVEVHREPEPTVGGRGAEVVAVRFEVATVLRGVATDLEPLEPTGPEREGFRELGEDSAADVLGQRPQQLLVGDGVVATALAPHVRRLCPFALDDGFRPRLDRASGRPPIDQFLTEVLRER